MGCKKYKLQNTNHKQTTNPKLQTTKKAAPCGHFGMMNDEL
jgi:hypothetical protein